MADHQVHLRNSSNHPKQLALIESTSKRLIVKAGRRFGKTVGAAQKAVRTFLKGHRVLYGAPTIEQVGTFWFEVKRALAEPIAAGIFRCNESEHTIELPGTKQRIRAKTCWNADTLRGDFADLLILDEFQLMAEDAWDEVGAPMLLDNNGDAVFIFTPPSLQSSGVSKARDPRHASKMFKSALLDDTGLWQAIHAATSESPYISAEALNLVTRDMSLDSYRREILAEDDEIEQSWLVYSRFNPSVCVVSPIPINDKWLIHVGHDFGQANPAALFIAQDPGTGLFYIFNEYLPGAGRTIHDNVEEFKRITQGYQVIKRVGGNQTTEDETRQGYSAHGWPITAPNTTKPAMQIERVKILFERNKVMVFNTLHNLLAELSSCMWELDETNQPKDKIKDEAKYHLLAALRYILSDFTPETISKQKTRQTSYY